MKKYTATEKQRIVTNYSLFQPSEMETRRPVWLRWGAIAGLLTTMGAIVCGVLLLVALSS